MKLRRALGLRVLPMLLAATAISSASTVVLDATKQGAVFTNFAALSLSGATVTSVDSPAVQLVLGPGTYTITDGATSGTDSAWNWSYGGTGSQSNGNWLWAFAAVNDATKAVLLDDYVGTSATNLVYFTSQTLAATATGVNFYGGVSGTAHGTTLLSATSTTSFSDTLTLTSTTTVDFIVPESTVAGLSDNLGGMTLNVTLNQTGVPEPASFLLVVTALAAGCLRLRRRAR